MKNQFPSKETSGMLEDEMDYCENLIEIIEKHDRKELKTLIEKSRQAGMTIKNVIGDAAYSEKNNIEYAQKEKIHLVSKLSKYSANWHSGDHNLLFWTNYLLGTIVAAYKELEERVGTVVTTKGNKSHRIEEFIEHRLGYFTKEDIRNACPDVGEATINRVLKALKEEGKIENVGKGRSAKWLKK